MIPTPCKTLPKQSIFTSPLEKPRIAHPIKSGKHKAMMVFFRPIAPAKTPMKTEPKSWPILLKLAGIHHKAKYSIRQAPINRKTFYLKCLKYFYTHSLQKSLRKIVHISRAWISGEKISKSQLDTAFWIFPHFFSTVSPAILPAGPLLLDCQCWKSAGKFKMLHRVLTLLFFSRRGFDNFGA